MEGPIRLVGLADLLGSRKHFPVDAIQKEKMGITIGAQVDYVDEKVPSLTSLFSL